MANKGKGCKELVPRHSGRLTPGACSRMERAMEKPVRQAARAQCADGLAEWQARDREAMLEAELEEWQAIVALEMEQERAEYARYLASQPRITRWTVQPDVPRLMVLR